MHSTEVILFQLFLSEFCPFSTCDNIRSPDNFRLIMLRERSYSYMCGKCLDKIAVQLRRTTSAEEVQGDG